MLSIQLFAYLIGIGIRANYNRSGFIWVIVEQLLS